MNVLSLFDGISCGRVALERAGIKVDKYYAAEIDKYAIQQSEKNYPGIIRLGDVTQWRNWNIQWETIDLVIAGSPCQGFSLAGKQLAFDDPRSALFFEFVKILKYIDFAREVEWRISPVKFLLENVHMKQEYLDVISEQLGVKPVKINSSLVSAQNRVRYYWANWEFGQPEDKGIVLNDIIETGRVDRDKSFCIDVNYFKGGNLKSYFEKHRRQLVFSDSGLCHIGDADLKGNDCIKRVYSSKGKCPTLTTMGGGHREPKIDIGDLKWRKLTPLECERLQTLPDNYTEGVSNTQRYKMLGNGWTVDSVAHIFKQIKDK